MLFWLVSRHDVTNNFIAVLPMDLQKNVLRFLQLIYQPQKIAFNFRNPEKTVVGRIISRVTTKQNEFLERAAVDLLEIQPNDNVLEIGFGTGIGIRYASQFSTGNDGSIYGIDPSEYMMKKATDLCSYEIAGLRRVSLFRNIVSMMPFPNDYFNGVFHCNTFHFWPNLMSSNSEIFRVLKPGGRMVCTLCLEHIAHIQQVGLLYPDVFIHIDPLEYMVSLEAVGMKDVQIKYFNHGKVEYQAIFATKPTVEELTVAAKENFPVEFVGPSEDQEEVLLRLVLGNVAEEAEKIFNPNMIERATVEPRHRLTAGKTEWVESTEMTPRVKMQFPWGK